MTKNAPDYGLTPFLRDLLLGAFAWDIGPLYSIGNGDLTMWDGMPTGTGGFQRTVAFEQHCFYASAVNYALWGRINRLSHDFFDAKAGWNNAYEASHFTVEMAVKTVRQWKHNPYYLDFGDTVPQAEAFTRLGYDGSAVPASLALPCKWSGQTHNKGSMAWRWLPNRPYPGK